VLIRIHDHDIPRNQAPGAYLHAFMAHNNGVSVQIGPLADRQDRTLANFEADAAPKGATAGTQGPSTIYHPRLRPAAHPEHVPAREIPPEKQSPEYLTRSVSSDEPGCTSESRQ